MERKFTERFLLFFFISLHSRTCLNVINLLLFFFSCSFSDILKSLDNSNALTSNKFFFFVMAKLSFILVILKKTKAVVKAESSLSLRLIREGRPNDGAETDELTVTAH